MKTKFNVLMCVLVTALSTASFASKADDVPVLDSNTGSMCYGYASTMNSKFHNKRYAFMEEYYGDYYDRLQSQEYGTKNADIMHEYFISGSTKVKNNLSIKDNRVPVCEKIFDKYNKM